MSKIEGESIYQYLNRMATEYPGLPYSFQAPFVAGRIDVRYVFWEDQMPFTLKERFAMELVDQMAIALDDSAGLQELRSMLHQRPIFLYLTVLNLRIKLYLSENRLDKDKLYSLGMRLATESDQEQEVKLGMLILGFFDNDLVRKILKILGLHSSLTLYALEASKNFVHNQNQFAFELAQHTSGYGKLAALHLLKPITPEQQRWVFEQGAINEIAPNLSVIICLEKADMIEFYRNLIITKETFPKLSYLLAYASEEGDIKDISQSLILVEKVVEVAKSYAKFFIDIAAIVMIMNRMRPYWERHGVDVEKQNGWTSNKENEIRNQLSEILKLPKWKNIVLQELSDPHHQTSLIVKVLKGLQLLPAFEDLLPLLLSRDLFDMDILEFLLLDHPSIYLDDAFDYLQRVLPEEVLGDVPHEMPEDGITGEHKPDIWLVYLLKAMRKERRNEEAFFIRCLTARFPDVRVEAIQALRVFKLEWSGNVLPALERAYEREPVKNIRKRILRLMGKETGKKEKEQRYVDVSEMKVTPSPWDIRLLKTKIAGTFFRDLLVVEDRMESGDLLYLVREPENPYDDKAILVTAEDGYVLGYVPRENNAFPASLMDAGEKLYAVLLSDDLGNGKPEIQIMLNRRPEKTGQVISFPNLRDSTR